MGAGRPVPMLPEGRARAGSPQARMRGVPSGSATSRSYEYWDWAAEPSPASACATVTVTLSVARSDLRSLRSTFPLSR